MSTNELPEIPEWLEGLLDTLAEGGATMLLLQDDTPLILARLPTARSIVGVPVRYQFQVYHLDPEGYLVRIVLAFLYVTGDAAPTLQIQLGNEALFRFEERDEGLGVDLFLNPSDPEDRAVLTRLAQVSEVYLTVYCTNQAKTRLGTMSLRWEEASRQAAQKALEWGRQKLTLWPQAKERYIREHPDFDAD